MRVNCEAPIILAHYFGKKMAERGKGGMIFLASLVGYAGVPYMANYSASKAYNLYVAESMWQELRRHNVDVLSLAPGATKTEFADVAGMNMAMAMKAAPVVRIGLNALGRKPTVIAGLRNKFMYYSLQPLPRRMRSFIMGTVMKSYMK